MKSKIFKLLSALLALTIILTTVTTTPNPGNTLPEKRDSAQEESREENSDISPMCEDATEAVLDD